MERLVLVRCPSLVRADDVGAGLHGFVDVVEALEALCPWVTVVRVGLCSVPARGPSRYFGGEDAVVRLLVGAAEDVGVTDVQVGIADGLFAASLAARANVVVPPGCTAAFLAPMPVEVLGQPELAQLLVRLGLPTLGAFANLPERAVLARFGTEGVIGHRLARGVEGEQPGLRQPAAARQVAAVRRSRTPTGVSRDSAHQQPGFWGERDHTDQRAAQALGAIQVQLGTGAVQVLRRHGGRAPTDQELPTTWVVPGTASATREAPATREQRPPVGDAPWPGQLPPPAPALVHRPPLRALLVDAGGRPVSVRGRSALTTAPDRLVVGQRRWMTVEDWAGPWPRWERWWTSAGRRQAHLQVVTTDGNAYLLAAQPDGWWLVATYD